MRDPHTPAGLEGDSVGSVNELAATLADVHVSLAVASNQQESLAAVMRYIARTNPAQVVLHYVHVDEKGRPHTLEPAALWQSGKVEKQHPLYGTPHKLADLPTVSLFINNPHDLVTIADVMTDSRCDERLREACRQGGIGAMTILPLYSVGHAAWQGMLCINWPAPRATSSEERFVFSMLMATLASFLANQRSEQALRAALIEKNEQSSLLRAVLEHLPVGVVMVEAPSGKPRLVNRRAAEISGRPIDLEVGKEQYAQTYRLLRPGTDELMPTEELPLPRTLATGEATTVDVETVIADGQRRMLEGTSVPILDESGQMRNAVLVLVDATERKRAEKERLRMQEELITVQAAALAERSTPIIPISDAIVVVPLIGSLDADRGAQLMDTLLSGVSQNRARVAIIDITGVRTLDTQAARTLTSAAQALRLLGVEPVLTGIRAEVAQTLVTLGVGLDNIATRNNLQSGIALAQKFVGQKSI